MAFIFTSTVDEEPAYAKFFEAAFVDVANLTKTLAIREFFISPFLMPSEYIDVIVFSFTGRNDVIDLDVIP